MFRGQAARSLRVNFLQESRCRFIFWILRNEAALDGELEDGLAELGDGVGGVVEEVEMIAHARPGGCEGLRLAGGQQVMERGLLELGAGIVPRLLPRAKLVAQGHQLIHLGHNPPLLGQRGDGCESSSQIALGNLIYSCGVYLCYDLSKHW